MSDLARERCEACTASSPLVPTAERPALMQQLPGWRLHHPNTDVLERSFSFKTFALALGFTNQVGAIAEEEGHHPQLTTEWGKVTVRWWTHAIGGLHRNDFVMAAKTQALYGA